MANYNVTSKVSIVDGLIKQSVGTTVAVAQVTSGAEGFTMATATAAGGASITFANLATPKQIYIGNTHATVTTEIGIHDGASTLYPFASLAPGEELVFPIKAAADIRAISITSAGSIYVMALET